MKLTSYISGETAQKVIDFRDARDWKQFHTPKDLALSLSLEAAELLEVFQWSAADLQCPEKKSQMEEELADIASYCILFADAAGIDLEEALQKKIQKNAEKYPVALAYGSKAKYTELKYAETEHKQGETT